MVNPLNIDIAWSDVVDDGAVVFSMQWGVMSFQYRVVYDDLHSTMLFLADFAGNGKWKACR